MDEISKREYSCSMRKSKKYSKRMNNQQRKEKLGIKKKRLKRQEEIESVKNREYNKKENTARKQKRKNAKRKR